MRKKKPFEWGYLLLLPGLGFVVLFLAAALGMMIIQSFGLLNFTGTSAFSLQYWKELFSGDLGGSLFYSLKIAVWTVSSASSSSIPLSLW